MKLDIQPTAGNKKRLLVGLSWDALPGSNPSRSLLGTIIHTFKFGREWANSEKIEKQLLSEVEINASFHCVGVKDSSTDFLKYLDKQKIALGSVVKVIDKEDFDDTLTVEIDGKRLTISNKIANNLYVQ